MKKIKVLFIVGLLAGFANTINAQALAGPTNVIKCNLFALGLSNISLQYEKAIHKNVSLAFQGGLLLERGLPKMISAGDNSTFNDLTVSGFNCAPELRFYPGKKEKKQAPKGFYLAPYGRFSRYVAKALFMYTDSSTVPPQETPVEFKGTFTGFGGGLLIGAQFIIADKVSIDWWIGGGHFGVSKLTGSIESQLVSNDPDGFREQMNEAEVPYGTKVVDVAGSKASVTIGGLPFAGVRSGLCIGFAF